MAFVKWFSKISKQDVLEAGGKGASLGEMTRAGIPVPSGFVITSSAFELFLEDNELASEIDSILHRIDVKNMETIERASEKIKTLILAGAIPKNIGLEIKITFSKLGAKFVAVRSSATAEDSASAAWAGQLESYLNTEGKNLLANVKKCWASLFTPRAIFYRIEQGLADAKVSVAVVVQEMVESEISGIAFSVHPVTQDRNQILIEAGLGLGEAIVSGQITPDNYVINKNNLEIIERNINEQTKKMVRAKGSGNEWFNVRDDNQKLSDDQIIELSKMIIKIERHYSFPCDIEWAYQKGKFYIVQSRPITTLNEKITKELSLWEETKSLLGSRSLIRVEGGFIPFLVLIDWINYYDNKGQLKNAYPVVFYFSKKRTVAYLSDTYRDCAKETLKHILTNEMKISLIQKQYDSMSAKIDKTYTKFFDRQKSIALDEHELMKYFRMTYSDTRELVARTLFIEQMDEDIVKDACNSRKIDLKKIWAAVKSPHLKTFETRNKEAMLKTLAGKKSVRSIMYCFLNYTFLPDEQSIRGELKKEKLSNLEREIDKNNSQRARALRVFKANLKKMTPEEQKIAKTLNWIIKIRDERRDIINKAELVMYECATGLFKIWGIDQALVKNTGIIEINQGREHVLSISKELKNRTGAFGMLFRPDRSYRTELGDMHQEILEIDREILEKHANAIDGKILGETGSKGKATGIARIVRRKEEFGRFKMGEILVTGMTRPEFVPLMKLAAAIVTDEGGITSHAAIVARELGKPCIIGTKIATQVLKDGDLVEVDADNGLVKVLRAKNQLQQSLDDKPIKKREYGEKIIDSPLIDFNKRKWVVYGASGWPAYITPFAIVPSRIFLEMHGISNEVVAIWKGKVFDWLYDEAQLNELASKALPGLLRKKWLAYDEWLLLASKFRKLHYNLFNSDTNNFSDAELNHWIDGYYHAFVEQFAANNFIEPLSFYFQNHLKELLTSEGVESSETEKLAGAYSTSKKPNYIKQCVQEYKKAKSKKEIAAVLEKYHYINNDYTSSRKVSEHDLIKLGETNHNYSTPDKSNNTLPRKAKDLLEVLQMTATIQDVRKAESLMWITGTEKLLRELAKRKAIPFDLMLFATWEEILQEKYHVGELKRRSLGCAINWKKDKVEVFSGDDAVQIMKDFRKAILGDTKDVREFKGVPASGGRVKGRAAVVLNVSQFNKVQKGDILITVMTRPEYLPVMQLASAFVTDEGGITSHAAIVAREMKKPCVIATKIASKVIKDGDIVEVDADNGVVRIIDRQKRNRDVPTYSKVFSRDFCLASVEAWVRGETTNPKEWTELRQPFQPYIITERTDDTVNFYYDPRGVQWVQELLIRLARQDKSFLDKIEKTVIDRLKYIMPIYEQEKVLNISELKRFLKELEDGYPWFEAMWWFCQTEESKLSGLDLENIQKARSLTDRLCNGSDNVIRKSLVKSFPQLKELSSLLTTKEIISGKIPSKNELEKRARGYFFANSTLFTSTAATNIEKHFHIEFEKNAYDHGSTLSGEIAQKGFARGFVRRVMGHKQINQVKHGEILVSPMTIPDFLPAMKKAAAIITDEGGVVCHAAIISRELKIPCIVGTKNATQALKDGDLVEVEADKGRVTIIRRAGEKRSA